jgi:hypothetical protein
MSRPPIKRPGSTSTPETPEALFQALQRNRSHAYLRGPQQDVLRDYFAAHSAGSDFAIELPTGAGKTAVGLLIAEWHRRKSNARTAFLTLTNQLAGQVLEEAKALSIPAADLRGNKGERDKREEMRYRDATAIAVSTYSNLFNVNPAISNCSTLVLDDAHGGGAFAASMWTVRIAADELPDIYSGLRAALTPLVTPTQLAELEEGLGSATVAFVDFAKSEAALDQAMAILASLPEKSNASYSWSKVRAHIHACHVLMSRDAVTIRPYIPPTWSHPPFAGALRRCFLSATLGDVDDLKRAYGIQHLELVQAKSSQDGRRYIFLPGMGLDDHQARVALTEIWRGLNPRRAVALAPSFLSAGSLVAKLSPIVSGARFLQAKDIEESLTPFTSAENVVLAMANRYDGLDLPDDDCRLLLLSESPRAVNDLEAGLASVWCLGSALRGREATRLVQGMGRCTRSATDYAVILLLGESLINALTTPELVARFPKSLQSELAWGKLQLGETAQNPKLFAEMVLSLINDADYRAAANEAIDESRVSSDVSPSSLLTIASREVAFSKAQWSGDFSHANEVARNIADRLSGDEWTGLRAWWLYLASLAARHSEAFVSELDALRRAKATGINSGWLDHLLRLRSREAKLDLHADDSDATEASVRQALWSTIDELGWAGRRYHDFCKEMTSDIAATNNHKLFHRGLVSLGRLLGARSWAPTGQGTPDVVWGFGDQLWICFEAKCEKLSEGTGFAKRDLLEAKGHLDWLKATVSISAQAALYSVIIGPTAKTHAVAEPHRESLHFVSNSALLSKAKAAEKAVQKLRVMFTGRDYPRAKDEFQVEMEAQRLQLSETATFLTSTTL